MTWFSVISSNQPFAQAVQNIATRGGLEVEVLTGPGRRGRWSVDQKAPIVAETLEPGARDADVARLWQFCSQQVFSWRRAARRDVPARSTKTTGSEAPGF